MDLIWGHISTEPMRCPELKNICLTLWAIRKTSFLFHGHVLVLLLTIVCLEGATSACGVRHHHPVRAGIVRPPPGPDIDEGIRCPRIVAAIRIVMSYGADI